MRLYSHYLVSKQVWVLSSVLGSNKKGNPVWVPLKSLFNPKSSKADSDPNVIA